MSSAASIMVAYNQPSGETTPSREDIDVTKRLAEAGKLMGNELLDHLIFGEEKYTSLKEKGYIRGRSMCYYNTEHFALFMSLRFGIDVDEEQVGEESVLLYKEELGENLVSEGTA